MTAAHADLMRDVAAAFAQGDLKPLFAAIAPDVIWKSAPITKDQFIFGGTYPDRLGVVEVTAELSAAYVFRHLLPIEITAVGDTVWGLFRMEGDYLPRGHGSTQRRPFALECVIHWRMRDGKIAEHRAFFDTASLLRQQHP